MKAARIHQLGGPEVFQLEEVEIPVPQPHEVLIRVAVAGVNYADIGQRNGRYPIPVPLPAILGLEAAGTVTQIGDAVQNLPVGSRVMAVVPNSYAQYVVADAAKVIPIPNGIDFGQATALLVQGLTALALLQDVPTGSTILVHAAAGGVGSLLVQLAKLKGLHVIGTASTSEKLETVKQLGADTAINYTREDWVNQVLDATNGRGVDWVLEMVGGEIGKRSAEVLARNGTMIVYGSASGQPSMFAGQQLIFKSQTIRGYSLYNESPQKLAAYTHQLVQYVTEGKLQINVQSFPLEKVAEAHQAVESRKTQGKVVLAV